MGSSVAIRFSFLIIIFSNILTVFIVDCRKRNTAICPRLPTSNAELKCKFKGEYIDCKGLLLSGTEVISRCEPFHHLRPEFSPNDDTMRCQHNGTWSRKQLICDPDCGTSKHKELSTEELFPWNVAIYSVRKNLKLLICGGTLITPNVVLSAAHCFFNEIHGAQETRATDYVVTVGKLSRNYSTIDSPAQKTFEISEILFSEKPYNPKLGSYVADIAIIVLKDRVTLSTSMFPACFRPRVPRVDFNPGENVKGVLVGWGLEENGTLPENRKIIQLSFMNYNKCVQKMVGVTHDKFCARAEEGPGIQPGDGGSGLFFKDEETSRYYLRGIASTIDMYSEIPVGSFTDISYYQHWINRVVEDNLEKRFTGPFNIGAYEPEFLTGDSQI